MVYPSFVKDCPGCRRPYVSPAYRFIHRLCVNNQPWTHKMYYLFYSPLFQLSNIACFRGTMYIKRPIWIKWGFLYLFWSHITICGTDSSTNCAHSLSCSTEPPQSPKHWDLFIPRRIRLVGPISKSISFQLLPSHFQDIFAGLEQGWLLSSLRCTAVAFVKTCNQECRPIIFIIGLSQWH